MFPANALVVLAVALGSPDGADVSARVVSPPRYEVSVTFVRYRRGALESADGVDWAYGVYGAGATLGRYWSHHHRTELSVEATSSAHTEATYFVGCCVYGAFVSHDYRHELISLSHVVQLGRNRWVHPQIGLGATLDVEHRRSSLPFLLPEFEDGFESPTHGDRERALAAHPSRTAVALRPFGMGALKIYFTPRVFLRAGVRVSPTGGPQRWTLLVAAGRDW